jgi:WD40 repeat protein
LLISGLGKRFALFSSRLTTGSTILEIALAGEDDLFRSFTEWLLGRCWFDNGANICLGGVILRDALIQLASGLLLSSFTAHYRALTALTFTEDSHLLLSASLDSSVHVFMVSHLFNDETGKPYGTLGDHTLGVRAVVVGKTAGSAGGRCWTASDDGTVKVCQVGAC